MRQAGKCVAQETQWIVCAREDQGDDRFSLEARGAQERRGRIRDEERRGSSREKGREEARG